MPSREKIINHYMRQFNERRRKKTRRRTVLLPFRIIFGIVLVLIAVYFAVSVWQGLRSPMTTAIASDSNINREFSIVGYFVREEQVITNDESGILLYVVDDGEKLGRYDEYASVYANKSAAELRSIIRNYQQQIEVLRRARAAVGSADSISSLSDQIYSGLYTCASLADSYDYSRLGEFSQTLRNNIITRELVDTSSEEIDALITTLENRCETLSGQIGARETSLTVPRSGYFSSQVDGYESVFDTDDLSLLKPSDLDRLISQRRAVEPQQSGKLVTGFGGYFVANISTADASNLSVGRSIKLQLDAMGDELVDMTVESISIQENGLVTVVFSYNRHMEELINMRKQSAMVVLEQYEGLKVPREAARVDADGNMGVYVITGLYTEFKKIDILYETEDYYIVATDPSKTTSVLRGDTIVVSGKNLSDGKVIG